MRIDADASALSDCVNELCHPSVECLGARLEKPVSARASMKLGDARDTGELWLGHLIVRGALADELRT